MQSIGTTRDAKEALEAKLKKFRDEPVGISGIKDADILPLYEFLMAAERLRSGALHWFCDEADSTVKEIAILLTRLHAFKQERVDLWRERMITVLHGCCKCVMGLEEAKKTSASTCVAATSDNLRALNIDLRYYGAFSQQVRHRFWTSFEEWEVQTIVDALKALGVTPESKKGLDAAPAQLVFYILSRAKAFADPFIQQVVSKPFKTIPLSWPIDPLPAGYVLFSMHEQSHVSSWAFDHLDQIIKAQTETDFGLAKDRLTPAHETLILVASQQLSNDLPDREGLTPYLGMAQSISSSFPFSLAPENVWKGVLPIIRLLSDESIAYFGLHKTVLNHLHDAESRMWPADLRIWILTELHLDFVEVLRNMLQVTKKLGKKLWTGENDDYPQVVFDSIKDNPRFVDLVLKYDPSEGKAWHLLLFLEIFRSLWDHPAYGDVLAKFAALTCEELQHERFESARPYITENAIRVSATFAS